MWQVTQRHIQIISVLNAVANMASKWLSGVLFIKLLNTSSVPNDSFLSFILLESLSFREAVGSTMIPMLGAVTLSAGSGWLSLFRA